MAEQSAVPMIVLTRHQDNVEAINSTLRNAGLPVRCNWIRELNDLGEALTQINAHMLVAFVGQDPADIAKVMAVSKQFGAGRAGADRARSDRRGQRSPQRCSRAHAMQ